MKNVLFFVVTLMFSSLAFAEEGSLNWSSIEMSDQVAQATQSLTDESQSRHVGQVISKSNWTTQDTVLQVATTALILADWHQTRWFVKNPCAKSPLGGIDCDHPYREVGVARMYIGTNPSVHRVNQYFAASLVANAALAYVLPPVWRTRLLVGQLFVQIVSVKGNYDKDIGHKVNIGRNF